MQAIVDDLIDDREIDEEEGDSDDSGRSHKRKKSDDEDDLDDRLEDEDYDLIEENLGVKVERKRFKRLRRIQDEESDGEDKDEDESRQRERIAERIFDSDEVSCLFGVEIWSAEERGAVFYLIGCLSFAGCYHEICKKN